MVAVDAGCADRRGTPEAQMAIAVIVRTQRSMGSLGMKALIKVRHVSGSKGCLDIISYGTILRTNKWTK